MLDAIVHINITQTECVCPVIPAKNTSHEVRNEEGECRREVICIAHCIAELAEGDVSTVSRKDTFNDEVSYGSSAECNAITMIGHCV